MLAEEQAFRPWCLSSSWPKLRHMRIGIDVGGTNTDVVLLDGNTVIAEVKNPTSRDVTTGIRRGIGTIRQQFPDLKAHSVVLGTTHFINAVTQGVGVGKVAAIRVATPPQSISPFADWPKRLATVCNGGVHVVAGGHQFDGRSLSDLDEAAVRKIAADMQDQGVTQAAVTAVFSSLDPSAEESVARILREENPDVEVTLSHEIGRVGLLGRENACILNAALRPLAREVIAALSELLDELKIHAPVFLTSNGGASMSLDRVQRYPIFAIGSGPTNSMRGASVLCGLDEVDAAVVVDVGGTTTDIGLLQRGFPRESTISVDLGGVRSNFRMPDVVSLGIGGGSIVDEQSGQVGPESVGFRITEQSRVFGGSTLTFTDIVVATGAVDIGDRALVADVPQELIDQAFKDVGSRVNAVIEQVRGAAQQVTVAIVGGGAPLVEGIVGEGAVVPNNPGSANAVGAALALASGEVDKIVMLDTVTREDALSEATDEAVAKAVAAGADENEVRVLEVEDIPMSHLPGGMATRIRVHAVGNMILEGEMK